MPHRPDAHLIHLTGEHCSSFRADVDDVNNMDESMDTMEQSAGGISRRDMIKASVIAGGLVWSAPVLLAGRASAAPATCCPSIFETAFAIKFTPGNNQGNCGATCLDANIAGNINNLPCPSLSCLLGGSDPFITATVTDSSATIVFDENFRVIAAAVQTNKYCLFTYCELTGGLSTAQNSGTANSCDDSGAPDCPNIVPNGDDPNRVWVETVPTSSIVRVELQPEDFTGQSGLSQVEIFLCVNSVVTGMCGG
jgi:hypothetical protein